MKLRAFARAGLAIAVCVPGLLVAGVARAQSLAVSAPLTAAAQPAEAAATRAVAARDLARGEVLTAEDIRHMPIAPGDSPRGDAPESLVGWRTRRVISEGEPLRKPAVSPPDLVRAGESVQAVYKGRSVVLRIAGTAAGSGAMGDRVLVRVDTRRRLEGVVIGPALVELDMNESR